MITGSPKYFWCDHRVTKVFLVWSQGHQSIFGVVTGSPKYFWCGHRVTKVFLVWSQGHQSIFRVVTGSAKYFSCGHRVTKIFWVWSQLHENFSALLHGVTEQCCAEQSQRTSHVHPMVPQVPSSSAAHALSESILY